jgi:hypothetical protein
MALELASLSEDLLESFLTSESTMPTRLLRRPWNCAYYPMIKDSGVFSADEDSGSVIVDGLGRYGGLLTGGAGKMASSDCNTHLVAPRGHQSKCICDLSLLRAFPWPI